jgi:hypothetical protein
MTLKKQVVVDNGAMSGKMATIGQSRKRQKKRTRKMMMRKRRRMGGRSS